MKNAICMRPCYHHDVPSLQVRDLPEPIHRRLVERARRERRTLSQEATMLLAKALDISTARAEQRRELLASFARDPLVKKKQRLSEPAALIREDRTR